MERGILLEIEGRQAVVLTSGGEFVSIPAGSAWAVGQEVSFDRPAATRQPRLGWLRYAAVAAAAVVLAVGLAVYSGYGVEAAVATVTIDINPSLQLSVSAPGNVVAAKALNADGQVVLNDLSYRRRPLPAVVADITDLAVTHRFLDPAGADSLVVIAAEPLHAGANLPPDLVPMLQQQAQTQARAKLHSHKGVSEVHVNFTVVSVSPDLKAAAQKDDLTPGKTFLLERAQEKGITLDPKELRDKSVREIVKEIAKQAGESTNSIIQELQLPPILGGDGGHGSGPDNGKKPPAGTTGDQKDKGKSGNGSGDKGKKGEGEKDKGKGLGLGLGLDGGGTGKAPGQGEDRKAGQSDPPERPGGGGDRAPGNKEPKDNGP